MIGDFLDKRVWYVGDRNVACRSGSHVHGIRPNTAQCNHLALGQAVDNMLADAHAFGDDRIGIMCDADEVILSGDGNFDDLCIDRGKGFHLQLVPLA